MIHCDWLGHVTLAESFVRGRPPCVPVLVFPGCQSTRCVCALVRGEHLDWLLVTVEYL